MLGNNFATDKENAQKSISITFVGEPGSGKSVLRGSFSPITKKTCPFQFSYFSTESYKMLAYELALESESLLELCLKKDDLDNAVVVISIDLSKPQNVMKSLLSWISKLKSYVTKVDAERNSTKSQVSWFRYSQYLDCEGMPRENRLNSNFNPSLIGLASCLNFGLKMVVVGTRSDTTSSDSEEKDFMHQSLRSICLLCNLIQIM
jgi:hypothetical protein